MHGNVHSSHRSVENTQRHRGAVVCRRSRCAVVCWLIVITVYSYFLTDSEVLMQSSISCHQDH